MAGGDYRGHIWTRPGLQDLADDVLGKDCEHISGLEVEGRHPRALMESALFSLDQVNGLVAFARTAQPPIRFEKSRSYQLRHHCVRLAISWIESRPLRGRVHLGPVAPK